MADTVRFLRAFIPESTRQLARWIPAARQLASVNERVCGSALRAFAASKPGGWVLELGAGHGMATTWLHAGLSASGRMAVVEPDRTMTHAVRQLLGHDPRITFVTADVNDWLATYRGALFDLVVGACNDPRQVVDRLAPGGLWLTDRPIHTEDLAAMLTRRMVYAAPLGEAFVVVRSPGAS